eukprot:5243307-Pyramimonas_sp.AAC.1
MAHAFGEAPRRIRVLLPPRLFAPLSSPPTECRINADVFTTAPKALTSPWNLSHLPAPAPWKVCSASKAPTTGLVPGNCGAPKGAQGGPQPVPQNS